MYHILVYVNALFCLKNQILLAAPAPFAQVCEWNTSFSGGWTWQGQKIFIWDGHHQAQHLVLSFSVTNSWYLMKWKDILLWHVSAMLLPHIPKLIPHEIWTDIAIGVYMPKSYSFLHALCLYLIAIYIGTVVFRSDGKAWNHTFSW